MTTSRVFLLSPANAAGPRGRLLRTSPNVPLASRLRSCYRFNAQDTAGEGVAIGEIYAFISAHYFRGKLAYADCFVPGRSFVSTFVGRGDMSRGGVLLRAVRAGQELEYIPVSCAALRGTRPPRLPRP